MATRTPAAAPETVVDPGTFISTVPVGFVAPSPTDIARIDRLMRDLPQTGGDRQFFANLLTIKMLAPEESRDLFIYPSPMVIDFVGKLKTVLTMRYFSK